MGIEGLVTFVVANGCVRQEYWIRHPGLRKIEIRLWKELLRRAVRLAGHSGKLAGPYQLLLAQTYYE
jgi:hypothetical protein